MTMRISQLDPQSQAFIAQLQQQAGVLPNGVAEVIGNAADNAQAPLTLDQLVPLVEAAMPTARQAAAFQKAVGDAKVAVSSHKGAGNGASFVTQMFDLRIEKEVNEVVNRPSRRTPARDPLYASFLMAPDADYMLLFNARDVDRNGRPMLMKVVVREGCDVNKLDLTQHRTPNNWQPDIMTVSKTADMIRVQDINEEEFEFGDPLKQVSLNGAGRQLSASVGLIRNNTLIRNFFHADGNGNPNPRSRAGRPRRETGEQLDQTPVVHFMDRLRVEAKATKADVAGWLDGVAKQFELDLHFDRGFIFEPNGTARARFAGKGMSTGVDAKDAHLLGSSAASLQFGEGKQPLPKWRMGDLLRAPVQVTTSTLGADQKDKRDAQTVSPKLVSLIYANSDERKIAGQPMVPLADMNIAATQFDGAGINAVKRPLLDPQRDGQVVNLRLAPGFVGGKHSCQGWQVAVGYMDNGKWVDCGSRQVRGDVSQTMEFDITIPDAVSVHRNQTKLEMRIFNEKGIPAQRVNIAMEQVDWDPALYR